MAELMGALFLCVFLSLFSYLPACLKGLPVSDAAQRGDQAPLTLALLCASSAPALG